MVQKTFYMPVPILSALKREATARGLNPSELAVQVLSKGLRRLNKRGDKKTDDLVVTQ